MRLLVVASVAVIAAATAAAAQQVPQLAPPRNVIVNAPVDVPMSLVNGVPIVDAMINGKGPFKFGIETGAGFSVIAPAAAAALNLPNIGSPQSPTYRLDRVTIGDAAFQDVEMASLTFAQSGIDGVFGLPFYGELLVTLDYPGRRVRIERGDLPPANGADVLPISHVGPFWGLPITVSGTPFTAILDTRSTGGFGFTPDTAKSVKFDGELQVIGRARGAAIAETDVRGGRIAGDVSIGRYRFPSPPASVRPLPPGFPSEPIVGARVLNNFVVTLDQRNRRLRLSRSGSDSIELADPSTGGSPATGTAPAAGSGAPVPAADYVGEYGDRVVSIVDGALTLNRGGRGQLKLVVTGPDAFTIDGIPEAKIEFVREEGRVVAIKVLTREGTWETAKRTR